MNATCPTSQTPSYQPGRSIVRLPPWHHSGIFETLSDREIDWWSRQFRIPEAWQGLPSRGGGLKVAVLDTGCDTEHRDLAQQIIFAHDVTKSRYGHKDMQGHGTHVAGVLCATENDWGIVGLLPDLKEAPGGGLIVVKVLGDDGSGLGEWVVRGIDVACEQGAQIINLSLGSPLEDPAISEAVRRAAAAGVIVVCAAGNDGASNSVYWPGRMKEVIAVGAVDERFEVAEFSSRGPEVDIAAPGVNILSCWPGNRHARLNGTSMATPFVAGCIGLAMSAGATFRGVDDVLEMLRKTAGDRGAPGHDHHYGFGLVRPELMRPPGSTETGDPLKAIAEVVQLLKARPADRQTSLALTKLQEAQHWLAHVEPA